MVKKKGKSKRISLKDKYKIQRRVVETHRKQRKQAKKDKASGKLIPKTKKDPGIPNAWPFKQELLKEIQQGREREKQLQLEAKQRKKKTVQELMEQATQDRQAFDAKQQQRHDSVASKKQSAAAGGQQSRRAYLRELKKVIDSADVLLQLLDARDPIGSRIHPSVENAILSRSDKRMVLVLNKIDLVPKDVVRQWLLHLRRTHPAVAVQTSLAATFSKTAADPKNDSASVATLATTTSDSNYAALGMDGLLQLIKNYARTGGDAKSKTTIVVGVVGYPNVGKSSLINALKRSRAVGVSPRPGFTTSIQEVVLDRNVRLLDSPGVVFDDQSTMVGNCLAHGDASMMEDPIAAVEDFILRRCNPSTLMMTYNIPAFNNNIDMFLGMVAKQTYGRVLKGGVPNKEAAARAVLRDWSSGKIPYYTTPPEAMNENSNSDAVIVSEFGKDFFAEMDDLVMKNLKDTTTDEMDFVQIKNVDEKSNTAVSKETIDILTGAVDMDTEMDQDDNDGNCEQDESDDDDDDDDDMEEDDANADKASAERMRDKLATAEDYDFSNM